MRPLVRSGVFGELASWSVEPIVAVFPGTMRDLGFLVSACREAGLRPTLWPMLHDHHGRWLSVANAHRFVEFTRAVIEAVPEARLGGVALDFEPPIEQVRGLVQGDPRPLFAHARSDGWLQTIGAIDQLERHLTERGLDVLAATVPFVLADARRPGWQRLLGTPVHALRRASMHAMAYSTLLLGYGRGVLGPRDARALLWLCARASRVRYGERAGISLGAVGPGALGDEASYVDPSGLADDVAVARAAGIEDVGLFDLGGALARPPVADWLRALVETEPATAAPVLTRRARAMVGLAYVIGWAGGIGSGAGGMEERD